MTGEADHVHVYRRTSQWHAIPHGVGFFQTLGPERCECGKVRPLELTDPAANAQAAVRFISRRFGRRSTWAGFRR